MTRTGPQKYPGASLSEYYQGTYPGNAMESNVGVIHTTEGTTLPDYDGGASAPNLTAVPDIANKKLRWWQHYDIDQSARALVNKAGGVETNTANAVQVELVGTCDPAKRTSWGRLRAGVDYLYWPDAPDWALAELGLFVRWCRDNHGIRAESTVQWKAYPGSYGDTDTRLTDAEWNAYYGWLGHQHVPENDHGDPGNIDFAKVIAFATGSATPVQTGTTMPEKPNRFVGHRAENLTLVDGSPQTIYWTEEFPDDANGHADGGKTVANNVTYSGVVTLVMTGLKREEIVHVYAAEEWQDGTPKGDSPVKREISGRDLGQMPISVSVPFNGTVADRLVFKVVSRQGSGSVTVEEAWVELHTWPMS